MREGAWETLDQETFDHAKADLAVEVETFDEVLLQISRGLGHLNQTQHDHGRDLLHVLLLNRAMNALWRGRQDALTGYSGPSFTMCRSAFEDWGTMMYTHAHPETVGAWLQNVAPKYEAGQPIPPFRDIWNELCRTVGEEVGLLYGRLCEFSHPRSLGLNWLFDVTSEGDLRFDAGPNYDRRKAALCLYDLTMIALLQLKLVDELHVRMLGQPVDSWREDTNLIARSAQELLRSQHEQFRRELDRTFDTP